MKKILHLFNSLLIVLASLFILNIYQTKDYQNLQDIEAGKGQTTKFYITNSSVSTTDHLSFLSSIKEKYRVSILRTDMEDGVIRKSILLHSDTFPASVFPDIKTIDFSDGFYANFATGNPKQKQTLPSFYYLNKLKITSLEEYYKNKDRTVNGNYTIVSENTYDVASIIKELSDFYQISPAMLSTPGGSEATSIVNRYLIIFSVVLAILALVVAVLTIYDTISKIKEIGVMKMMGLSNLRIMASRAKVDLLFLIAAMILTNTYFSLSLQTAPDNFYFHLLLSQLSILCFYLFLQVLVYLIVGNLSISKLLKNFADFKIGTFIMYGLKAITLLICSLILVSMSVTFQQLKQDRETEIAWSPYSNYLTLENYRLTTLGEADFSSGGTQGMRELRSLFSMLEKNENAFYIHYEKIEKGQKFYDYNETIHFTADDSYNIMTINSNYLSELGLTVDGQINSERLFLVPIKYKNTNIQEAIRHLLYNRYHRQEQEKLDVTSIKTKIIYYNENINIFSFDKEHRQINNPIFAVLTGENMLFHEEQFLGNVGALNNPIKIPYRETLGEAIETNISSRSKYLIPKFTILKDILAGNVNVQEIALVFVSFILLLVTGIELFVSLALSGIIFHSNKSNLMIKKLLGFTFVDRYRKHFYSFTILYLIGLLSLLIYSRSHLVLILFGGLILVDTLFTMFNIKKLENQNALQILKGE
ncbi:DUF1430 domain-containing protein [Streptococcus ruminantium]|uniref:DUF1430 domain-containing protein n=1 Tax=Streptococcus ruminantium TaxID=1917441 RepID=UPI00280E64EB|nr:DUF1430 domain-containing protein [Streptococcus ruminantium]MDQ8820910.1 DUF1430 domain-containing protein [Streptococcus ruminantium]MDQ8836927.1 DUF1430 domain-containing protein [Streptococcus ruminantium]